MEKDYRTIIGIKTHPLYDLLTDKQQVFLVTYLESGDRLKAAQTAYGLAKKDATAAKVLRTSYIRELVATFYGYQVDVMPMSKPEISGLLASHLRKAKTGQEFGNLMKYWLILTGRIRKVKKDEPEPDTVTDVDALVKKLEQEGK
jgi:hypothetical protein